MGVPVGFSLQASSGNIAAATATATLAAALNRTTYISGFDVTGAGATAAAVVNLTITGLLGGTRTYTMVAPAGVTTSLTPLVVLFDPPLPASAPNTAIVVSLPTLGAGNTNVTVNAQGYQLGAQ